MANRNFPNGGRIFTQHVRPIKQTVIFTVTPTNGNGVTAVKGAAAANVFMHTSISPTNGNPNPASGNILVQMKDNYYAILMTTASIESPLSGTPLTATTAGTAYTITALGTATAAQWLAAGVPSGITPVVGVSFIATATGTIGGSAAVQTSPASGIDHVEMVGQQVGTAPNMNNPTNQAGTGIGTNVVLQCLAAGALTAPAAGTTITLEIYFNDSTVTAGSASPGN
jgi:hypothetical protein